MNSLFQGLPKSLALPIYTSWLMKRGLSGANPLQTVKELDMFYQPL